MSSKYYDAGKDVNVLDGMSGFVLKNIKPDSSILEFGPSYGRMTKYMKEELNCKITIIEYNMDDLEIASQWAENSYNEDIDDLIWTKELKNKKFDYIIFTDVLEHLRKPEEILLEASKLLKKDGSILLSIPNVTHGDIIIGMYYNLFTYNEIGLLDNTHIHLWAKENIISMIEKNNLKIKQFVIFSIPMFQTEIGRTYKQEFISKELIEILKKRGEDNEVYEYGLEVCLKDE